MFELEAKAQKVQELRSRHGMASSDNDTDGEGEDRSSPDLGQTRALLFERKRAEAELEELDVEWTDVVDDHGRDEGAEELQCKWTDQAEPASTDFSTDTLCLSSVSGRSFQTESNTALLPLKEAQAQCERNFQEEQRRQFQDFQEELHGHH